METLAIQYLIVIGYSIVDTLLDASFYLLIGFLAAGIIKALVSENKIVKEIGKANVGSVIKASLYGTPLPLCSCSVVPMATSLRKNGASKGATVSFLISTPESGVDSIAISYAMLDPLMTVFRPVAAFLSAFAAGVVENFLDKSSDKVVLPQVSSDACTNCHCETEKIEEKATLGRRLKNGIQYAFTDLLGDIAYYLFIGLILSGIIAALIPANFFEYYLGNEWMSMVVMLLVGLPLYVCASSSTPIAAAFIMKGLSPGAALVFLLAGPATNMATMSVVNKVLGRRSLWSYVISIALVALLMGFVLNRIYDVFDISIQMQLGKAEALIPDWLKYISMIIFIPLLLWGLKHELKHRFFHKH
ncbi:SO_0444 family Cu/Zn efflux transporter [bacterium]|nr:SO_0444 family Cu/Zn efflux transporter [bacterium]